MRARKTRSAQLYVGPRAGASGATAGRLPGDGPASLPAGPSAGFNRAVPPASPAPAGPADSSYRLAAAVRLRLLGTVLAVLGGLVLVVGLLVALLDVPDTAFTVALTVSIALLLLSGYGLLRAAPLVSLDEVGYRVRYLRGAGVVAARWHEVQDVVTATVHGDDCVVLRHRDGRSTTIPVAVLDAPREDFVRDLGEHLHRGHGYRPVPGARA